MKNENNLQPLIEKKDFVQNSQKVTEYAKSQRKKDEGYNNRNVFSLTIKLSMLVSK